MDLRNLRGLSSREAVILVLTEWFGAALSDGALDEAGADGPPGLQAALQQALPSWSGDATQSLSSYLLGELLAKAMRDAPVSAEVPPADHEQLQRPFVEVAPMVDRRGEAHGGYWAGRDVLVRSGGPFIWVAGFTRAAVQSACDQLGASPVWKTLDRIYEPESDPRTYSSFQFRVDAQSRSPVPLPEVFAAPDEEALGAFITAWYGAHLPDQAAAVDGSPDPGSAPDSAPPPLLARMRQLNEQHQVIGTQDFLKRTNDSEWIGDVLVFATENQAVWLAGYRPGPTSPAVLLSCDDGRTWFDSRADMATFLLWFTVREAIDNGPYRAATVTDVESAEMVAATFTELRTWRGPAEVHQLPAGGRWPLVPLTLRATDSALLIERSDNRKVTLEVAAHTRDEIASTALADIGGWRWRYPPT